MIATFDRIGRHHSVSPQEIADHVEGGADAALLDKPVSMT
jgi:hypothetical protein